MSTNQTYAEDQRNRKWKSAYDWEKIFKWCAPQASCFLLRVFHKQPEENLNNKKINNKQLDRKMGQKI